MSKTNWDRNAIDENQKSKIWKDRDMKNTSLKDKNKEFRKIWVKIDTWIYTYIRNVFRTNT